MDGQAYLQLLRQRMERYFDIKPADEPFCLQAELRAADEGYFIVPNLKTYSVQHNEYVYAAAFKEPVTEKSVQPYIDYLKQQMNALKPTTEHMSSIFALVLICEGGCDKDTQNTLSKFKYHKDYCFTLKGWSDLAIYLVDLSQHKIYYNKAGQKIASVFALPESC